MKKALQVFLNENLSKPLEEFLPRKRYLRFDVLRAHNIANLAQLLANTEKNLIELKGVGRVSCKIIKQSLAGLGLAIKEDFIPEIREADRRRRELPEVSTEELEGMEQIMGSQNFQLFREYYEAQAQEQKIEARNKIVMQNRGLVKRALTIFASKIREGLRRDSSLSFQDINQQAFFGLVAAIEHFDPRKGFAFSNYAHWWIKQAIFRIVDVCGTIRLPSHRYWEVRRFQADVMELKQKKENSNLTPAEIAEALGMSLAEVEKLRIDSYIAFGAPLQLDDNIQYGFHKKSTATLHEITDLGDAFERPDMEAEAQDIQEKIEDMLQCLAPKKKYCLKLRFGLIDGVPLTLAQVGKIVGVSRERVRQIEAECLRKLRKTEHWEIFKEYFDLPDPGEHSEPPEKKRHYVQS